MDLLEFSGPKLHVDFYERFLPGDQAPQTFEFLEAHVPWSRKASQGRRSNPTFGDEGLVYELTLGGYGGQPKRLVRRKVLPWSNLPVLAELRDRVSEATGEGYNFCVVQRYPAAGVGIRPHRDKEMVPGTTICGLSLGSTRTLTLGPPRFLDSEPVCLELGPGSLYVLKPPTNDYWTHSSEKGTSDVPRLSLTFRNVPVRSQP